MAGAAGDADRDLARPSLRIECLAAHHDFSRFACGEEDLDRYIRDRAAEDEKRRAATVYVLVDPADPTPGIGYYTLSMFYFRRAAATKADQRRLPRYAEVPAVLIGRLAVDLAQRGRGLGGTLMVNALRRALQASESVAAAVVVVHALHEDAARFYEHHGFVRFGDEPLNLYLPLATFAAGLTGRG